ncbi:MoaD/ThiS family protein [Chloroflexota bacterium]
MSIKVQISPLFSQATNNQRIAEVNGNTVAEGLTHLVKQFPKFKLFDNDGKLLSYLGVSVNGELANPDELDKPIKDGDELSVVLMFDGG